ncbi:MAG: hypothetical protein DMF68_15715, partial [Acidobacteria bacterium]
TSFVACFDGEALGFRQAVLCEQSLAQANFQLFDKHIIFRLLFFIDCQRLSIVIFAFTSAPGFY